MAKKLQPLSIGEKFGDWTVISQLETDRNPRVGFSRVRCVCGTEKDIINNRLRSGRSLGCGCRRGRALAMSGITHGKSQSHNYRLWQSIKHRLKNDYCYMQQGIKICESWQSDFLAFESFILSLGPKPTPTHTLDRIDPGGDYEPTNLRWADKTTQSVNRRNAMIKNVLVNSIVVVGQTYDMLTVLEVFVQQKHGRNWYAARVQCDCGTIKNVYQKQLLSPKTKSCGCFKNKNLLLGAKSQELMDVQ